MTSDLKAFEPKKILVCQQRQIGDVVISTACVELLRQRYPEAELHFLTEKKCAPILENNPHLKQVWCIEKQEGFFGGMRLYAALRRQRFDLVADFQRLPRCRMATRFSGAPVRLTFPGKAHLRLIYTHFAGHTRGGYAGKVKASMLEALGIEWNHQPPRMYLSPAEQDWAEEHLRAQGLTKANMLITLDPTHWSETRRWPARHWAELIRLALRERPDLRFYLLHGPGERDQVETIVQQCGHEEACLLPPEDGPSLRRTAAVIANARLQVGNCSAPRHMAVALDVPTLTVIGSNGDTAWTFPSDDHQTIMHHLPCSKCNENTCPRGTLECLTELTPSSVLKRLSAMLRTAS